MPIKSQKLAYKLSRQYQTNLDLVEEMLDLVGRDITIANLEMKPTELARTARVNLLKTTRNQVINQLEKEGIVAKAIENVPEAIEITQGGDKIGYSLTYLHGFIMPQGLGSMLTVQVLDPKPNEIILDMAAAPGGKSCFIGERLNGKGFLYSNDVSSQRIRSLIFNLARHGISNVAIINEDGSNIKLDYVDKILLDAPCTGGGLIVSSPSRRTSRDLTDSLKMQKLQINLLKNAIELLEVGGVCVYATCAISQQENEAVITPFLDILEIEPTAITGFSGDISYHEQFSKAKRLFPSPHGCDGFFIARLVKK